VQCATEPPVSHTGSPNVMKRSDPPANPMRSSPHAAVIPCWFYPTGLPQPIFRAGKTGIRD
jgi:hypothetical protein